MRDRDDDELAGQDRVDDEVRVVLDERSTYIEGMLQLRPAGAERGNCERR